MGRRLGCEAQSGAPCPSAEQRAPPALTVKAHGRPGLWSLPGSRPTPMLGAQDLLSIGPWFVGRQPWLPPSPQPLVLRPSVPWVPGLGCGWGMGYAFHVHAGQTALGTRAAGSRGWGGCRHFWERRREALGSLAPVCPALPGPEPRSPGWDERHLSGRWAAPGAAAQTSCLFADGLWGGFWGRCP